MTGDPNLELLTIVAEALGELREDLVFAGGCATGLLITDSGAAPVRMTQDVDAIAEVVSLREYHVLGERPQRMPIVLARLHTLVKFLLPLQAVLQKDGLGCKLDAKTRALAMIKVSALNECRY